MPIIKPTRGTVHYIEGHPLGPTGGLKCHLLFNEGSGNIVYDLSGNENIGTLTGTAPSWTSGKFGSAILLPGTNEYISVADSDTVDCSNGFTAIIWVYIDDITATQGLIAKYSNTNGLREWRLITAGSVMYSQYYDTNDNNIRLCRYLTITAALYQDQWIQLAVTYDGGLSSSGIKIYRNEKQVDTSDANLGVFAGMTHGTQPLEIGAYQSGSTITGKYSHALLYNRVLSASEIALLCRKPFCMFERLISPAYFFLPAGGVVYQELNLTVIADASIAEIDTHAMVDTGKTVQADAAASESDTQQMIDIGKTVQADAAASESDTQQMVETGKEVSADASVSCTDLKVVFELNLTVTAAGSVVATEAHTMIETGKIVTAVASPAVIDTQTMMETGLGVLAEGSVSCTDSMGLLAHIAAFMILRQCTT